MIEVSTVLADIPHFDKFCSVAQLHQLAEDLRSDRRFLVQLAGTSVRDQPIYHIRFGTGRVKTLFVAFVHAMEPVGGLTVFSLLSLLKQGHPALQNLDVEWNVVPCIDPDGAVLNEGWSQNFTFENYLQNYFMQSAKDQADMSFPIAYKKLVVNQPSKEAGVLKSVLDTVRPDFYFCLHNTRFGGAFYLLSRDIGTCSYRRLYDLLERERFPLQKKAPWKEVGERYCDGVGEVLFTKKIYDYLEQVTPSPESYELIRYGAESWDYLAEIKPSALTFVAEMGCLRHPLDESDRPIGANLRREMLNIDADSKYLASVLVDEWDLVRGELDPRSPFYQAIVGGAVLPRKEDICNGGWPMSRYPTRDALLNSSYDRDMSEADLFNIAVVDGGFYFLQWAYQFLRLLRSADQSPAIQRAIKRSEKAFEEVRVSLTRRLDPQKFELVPCNTLARVQLGSGLIALDAVLERSAG